VSNDLGSASDAYALSNLQIQTDMALSADRTTAVSDGRCVSNQK
jgi:hypothetical protein